MSIIIYGREKWGPKAWHLLHAFSNNTLLNKSKLKDKEYNILKHKYYILYTTFIFILPCVECSNHYTEIIYNTNILEEEKINKTYLKKWVFKTHNIVNKFLKKPLYNYDKFLKEKFIINNNDIFFILRYTYTNFDYENISLFKYENIYNFFINFCYLYPDKNIKKKLRKIIKSESFLDIKTPLEFHSWFKENINLLKEIIIGDNNIYK